MTVSGLVLRGGVGPTATIPLFVTHGLGNFSGVGFTLSPTSLILGSTGNLVTLTGIGTSWTPGTPGSPTFTLTSTGTGASITAQTVASTTSATLTITAGTAGVITITDPGTGATATINVANATGAGANPRFFGSTLKSGDPTPNPLYRRSRL